MEEEEVVVVVEEYGAEEKDDVLVCGGCQTQYNDLDLFIEHKRACKPKRKKANVVQEEGEQLFVERVEKPKEGELPVEDCERILIEDDEGNFVEVSESEIELIGEEEAVEEIVQAPEQNVAVIQDEFGQNIEISEEELQNVEIVLEQENGDHASVNFANAEQNEDLVEDTPTAGEDLDEGSTIEEGDPSSAREEEENNEEVGLGDDKSGSLSDRASEASEAADENGASNSGSESRNEDHEEFDDLESLGTEWDPESEDLASDLDLLSEDLDSDHDQSNDLESTEDDPDDPHFDSDLDQSKDLESTDDDPDDPPSESLSKHEKEEQEEDAMSSRKRRIAPIRKGRPRKKTRPSGPKVCGYCKATFENESQYTRHRKTHTGERPFQCLFCGKVFSQKANVKCHILGAHKVWPHSTIRVTDDSLDENGENRNPGNIPMIQTEFVTNRGRDIEVSLKMKYPCAFCPFIYENHNDFKKHLKDCHSDKKVFLCDQSECFKTFDNAGDFIAHAANPGHPMVYKCEFGCQETFPTLDEINGHRLSHEADGDEEVDKRSHKARQKRDFRCETCARTFYSAKALTDHKLTETHDYPCHLCELVFKEKFRLKYHLDRVHCLKGFPCDICGKPFKTKGDLKRHMRSHTAKTPFACGECGRAFGRKDALNRHMKTHSARAEEKFKCPFHAHTGCAKTFSRRDHLQRHIKSHGSGNKFECMSCGLKVHSHHALHLHREKEHAIELPCPQCDLVFKVEAKRTKHLRDVHGIEFKMADDHEEEEKDVDEEEEAVDDDLESHDGEENNDANETQEVIVYVDKSPGVEAS